MPSDLEAGRGQHFRAKAQFPNAVCESGVCLPGPTDLSGKISTSPGLWRWGAGKQADSHLAFRSKWDPKRILEFPSSFLIG